MYATLCALLLTLTSLATTATLVSQDAVGVVWTFPNETWIENLAVRQNGAVLCTSLSRASIYQVNPFDHTTVTVHQFESGDGVLGISEIANDVFVAVSVAIDLATTTTTPGSAKIWRIDMSAWSLVC